MADTYEIAEANSDALWDALVREAVGGTVFSTSAWLRCAEAATSMRSRRFGCYCNGRLMAGVSGLEQQRRWGKRFATPPLTPHGGLLCVEPSGKTPAKPEALRHHAATLLAEHLAAEYAQVHLVLARDVTDIRPFLWAGYEGHVRYTYLFRLGDPDLLWERMERRTRAAIRKARKSGFEVADTKDPQLFRQLYEQVYVHQGGPPPVDAGVAERFVAQALEQKQADALKVSGPDGRVAALVVFVHGDDTTYAWTAGADPALSGTDATSLLYWRMLQSAPRPCFDFVGANIPPIARFKRGFGGDLTPYYAVERLPGGALGTGIRMARWFRSRGRPA